MGAQVNKFSFGTLNSKAQAKSQHSLSMFLKFLLFSSSHLLSLYQSQPSEIDFKEILSSL